MRRSFRAKKCLEYAEMCCNHPLCSKIAMLERKCTKENFHAQFSLYHFRKVESRCYSTNTNCIFCRMVESWCIAKKTSQVRILQKWKWNAVFWRAQIPDHWTFFQKKTSNDCRECYPILLAVLCWIFHFAFLEWFGSVSYSLDFISACCANWNAQCC